MARTHDSRTVSVRIERPLAEVYAFASRPQNFAVWAAGLGESLREDADGWLAETADGPLRLRFSPPNAFGILDHHVTPVAGNEVYIPMRAIANAGGTEILFTLFREPDWSDERFDADAALVLRDLQALKALLES